MSYGPILYIQYTHTAYCNNKTALSKQALFPHVLLHTFLFSQDNPELNVDAECCYVSSNTVRATHWQIQGVMKDDSHVTLRSPPHAPHMPMNATLHHFKMLR